MFKTKNLVHNINSVPTQWIFEHYCKLKEKLNGQDIKIKSLFNPKERTPSMCIYFDAKNKVYKYKDFSSGKGGSALDLVKELSGLNFYQACRSVVEKYNDYILHNNGSCDVQEFKQYSKYKVKSYVTRQWSTQDQYFWTQFNIGSKLLEEHNVKPLEHYILEKEVDGKPTSLKIRGSYLYGYFKKDGTLYKVYQPKTLDKKFIKVTDYIQGTEQCSPENKYLLITSSLKDVMAIKSLKLTGLNIIAPDSENSMIKSSYIEEWQKEYKKVILLFDNDDAGVKSMQKYKDKYPFLEIANLPMSKDVSDSIKDFGPIQVRNRLVPILDRKIS
jgi:5S rRNA maturation endonuclease (ribonuclease M5)